MTDKPSDQRLNEIKKRLDVERPTFWGADIEWLLASIAALKSKIPNQWYDEVQKEMALRIKIAHEQLATQQENAALKAKVVAEHQLFMTVCCDNLKAVNTIAALKERAEKAESKLLAISSTDGKAQDIVKELLGIRDGAERMWFETSQRLMAQVEALKADLKKAEQLSSSVITSYSELDMAYDSEREANNGLLAAMGEKDRALNYIESCLDGKQAMRDVAREALSTTPQDAYARLKAEAWRKAWEKVEDICNEFGDDPKACLGILGEWASGKRED